MLLPQPLCARWRRSVPSPVGRPIVMVMLLAPAEPSCCWQTPVEAVGGGAMGRTPTVSPTPTAGGLLVEPHPVASSAGCGEPYRLPMAAKKACTSSRVAWGKLSVSGSCRRAAIAFSAGGALEAVASCPCERHRSCTGSSSRSCGSVRSTASPRRNAAVVASSWWRSSSRRSCRSRRSSKTSAPATRGWVSSASS